MNTRTRDAGRAFAGNRLAVIGLVTLVLIAVFCFIGPLLWRTEQVHTSLGDTFLPPGTGHPLGTDDLGRDVLGRLMLGGQISLIVGISAAVIATTIGALYGSIAGYAGGAVDSVMMRVVDAVISIPTLFLILFVAALVAPTVGALILAVALTSWLVPARLVRGEALTLRNLDFVSMVKVMGGGSTRAVTRHVLPNTVSTLVVNATFQIADAILIIATLSFLGLGPRPPAASWGGVLSNGLQYEYSGYWWLIYPAGIAIIITVVAINLVGDGLRDALSPRSAR
ncbi:MAG: ABC transporter permease [Actinobacteria bacterium]|nr:ABC transporter permease [Actinomycetota bacterium]